MTDLTQAQLTTVLSALDGQPRNPTSKAATLAALALTPTSSAHRRCPPRGRRRPARRADQRRVVPNLPAGRCRRSGRTHRAHRRRSRLHRNSLCRAGARGRVELGAELSHRRRRRRRTVGRRNRRGRQSGTDLGGTCRKGPQASRRHQGGDADRHAAPAAGRHHRPDHRGDRLAHTVRGAFAGALKRKRGLTVTSEKPDGSERVYRTRPLILILVGRRPPGLPPGGVAFRTAPPATDRGSIHARHPQTLAATDRPRVFNWHRLTPLAEAAPPPARRSFVHYPPAPPACRSRACQRLTATST